jgi:hypothetical protein
MQAKFLVVEFQTLDEEIADLLLKASNLWQSDVEVWDDLSGTPDARAPFLGRSICSDSIHAVPSFSFCT